MFHSISRVSLRVLMLVKGYYNRYRSETSFRAIIFHRVLPSEVQRWQKRSAQLRVHEETTAVDLQTFRFHSTFYTLHYLVYYNVDSDIVVSEKKLLYI